MGTPGCSPRQVGLFVTCISAVERRTNEGDGFSGKAVEQFGFYFIYKNNPEAGEALWALGELVQGLVSKPDVHAVPLPGCWGSAGLGWPKSVVVLPAQPVSHCPLDAAAQHRAGQDNEPLPAWELLMGLHGVPFPCLHGVVQL